MNQLGNILNNLDEKQLKRLIEKIQKTHEYEILAEKTQIKNSAVEDKVHTGDLTTRQSHTFQVSEVAYTMVKESGMSEKEALVARMVGLCHDLGHTPFGHDGETFFGEKTGKSFSHAKYGAKIFDKIFKEILDSKNKKTGKDIFDDETKANFEVLRNYIKAGVNLHQDCYYMFRLEKQLKEFEEKYTAEELANNTKYVLLKNAINNPCIQAGMLADTVAFMQSDVRDLLTAKNPFDNSKTVISLEDQMKVAKEIGFTRDDILKIKEQLLLVGKNVDIEGLDENKALYKILDTLGKTNLEQIQIMIAGDIGEQGLNENGRFESVSDEYKLLLDNYEKGYREYIEFTGKNKDIDNWENFRETELAEQRKSLIAKNPLLCLTYEIQNELMYGKILSQQNIKLLNNDIERNRAIFSRVYDYLYKVTSKPASKLRIDELEDRVQMVQLRKDGNYPRQFNEKNKDGSVNKKAIITNLVIYKMQQMGNKELKDFYKQRIASKEKSLQIEIDTLEQEGKNDIEILDILQGIDIESYESFKQKDEEIREKVTTFQKKINQEVAPEFNVEKRDIMKLKQEKQL